MPSRQKVFYHTHLSIKWLLQQCHISGVAAGRVWRQRLVRVRCGLAGCLLAMSVSWSPLLVDSVLGLGHSWFVLTQDVVLARQVLHSLLDLLPEQVAIIKSAIGRLCLQARSLMWCCVGMDALP